MGWVNRSLARGNLMGELAAQGRLFTASAAAANTTVTGATSFATTTPTFLLDVPEGTTAFPLRFTGGQTGTVAGAVVHGIVVWDNADRYTSGGTAATVLNQMFHTRTSISTFYTATGSAIVATDAYGVRDMAISTAADVEPAEGALQELIWTPNGGPIGLRGPAAWLLHAYAGTTGPTLWYTFTWGEVRSVDYDTA
jgi:hypothetical protein